MLLADRHTEITIPSIHPTHPSIHPLIGLSVLNHSMLIWNRFKLTEEDQTKWNLSGHYFYRQHFAVWHGEIERKLRFINFLVYMLVLLLRRVVKVRICWQQHLCWQEFWQKTRIWITLWSSHLICIFLNCIIFSMYVHCVLYSREQQWRNYLIVL